MLRTAKTVGTVLLQQELGGLEEGADAQVSGHSLQFVDTGIEILLLSAAQGLPDGVQIQRLGQAAEKGELEVPVAHEAGQGVRNIHAGPGQGVEKGGGLHGLDLLYKK